MSESEIPASSPSGIRDWPTLCVRTMLPRVAIFPAPQACCTVIVLSVSVPMAKAKRSRADTKLIPFGMLRQRIRDRPTKENCSLILVVLRNG